MLGTALEHLELVVERRMLFNMDNTTHQSISFRLIIRYKYVNDLLPVQGSFV